MTGDLDMDSNVITGVADGSDDADATNIGQLAAAIADVETDLASVGTEITDLPAATRTDASWDPVYVNNENFVPIVQDGVAKKMPLELLTSMGPSLGATVTGTTYIWSSNETGILCNNDSPLVITLPTFGSAPGLHAPIRVVSIGAGSVTLEAAGSVVINRATGLPLTLRSRYSVAYFQPYFWLAGTTLYIAYGDLG